MAELFRLVFGDHADAILAHGAARLDLRIDADSWNGYTAMREDGSVVATRTDWWDV